MSLEATDQYRFRANSKRLLQTGIWRLYKLEYLMCRNRWSSNITDSLGVGYLL